jgi:hypothetical protein
LPFEHDATWYAFAVSRCTILLNKTRSPQATTESLTVVENDFNNLIAEEGQKIRRLGSSSAGSSAEPS